MEPRKHTRTGGASTCEDDYLVGGKASRKRHVALRLLILVVGLVICGGCRTGDRRPAYVGASSCAGCHAEEYTAWVESDHARAMSAATDTTVLGDFDDVIFEADGMRSVFRRAGNEFIIESHDADGTIDTLRVAYTFGWDPLQQYLVEFERGRLQSYTIAWDTRERNWFSLYPGEALRRGEYVHWAGAGMNWNYMCAECHSTDLRKGYDPSADAYRTTFEEINVACEACHGPGSAHEAWARKRNAAPTGPASGESVSEAQAAEARRHEQPADGKYGLTVALSHASRSDVELDVCARCHSRRTPIADDYVPGDAFLDHYRLSLLEDGLYFPDGQIDDEVYVYGSFLQSKMYRRGIRCSDCHNPHSGAVKLQGNALCSPCHLATTYDSASHLRHIPGTEASQCVTCHMPRRTYMQVDPRRDHSFKVPRPTESDRTGSPDVCRRCHSDRSPAKLSEDILQWNNGRTDDPSVTVADIIASARQGQNNTAEQLKAVLQDTSNAVITRATAVSLLGRFPVQQSLGAVVRELRNPEPLMRLGALEAVDDLGPMIAPSVLIPLLEDSVYSVRIEAARLLALNSMSSGDRDIPNLDAVLQDYRTSLAVNADQPGSLVNLAVLEERMGDDGAAAAAYDTALRLDSTFYPALINYGLLLNRARASVGIESESKQPRLARTRAESLFRRAAKPDDALGGRASYYLGLLLAEEEATLPEAASVLERAALLIGSDSRAFYNAGLAFQTLGDAEKATRYLGEAATLNPADPDPINAIVILRMQQEEWNLALEENDRLAGIVPSDPGIEARRQFILEQIKASKIE